MFYNNNNNQCKMCWNKAVIFGVGSIELCFRTIEFSYIIHAKMFSIQRLLHFSQIVLRICTLVLFIYAVILFMQIMRVVVRAHK